MSDWVRANDRQGWEPEHEQLSLGKAVRGLVSGDWRGAEAEQRSLSISPAADGGYLLPTPLSAHLIDRVRNAGRVFQAGVTTVPMTTPTLALARMTDGIAPTWKTENDAVNEETMVFDRVTLTCQTLPVIVRMSRELFDDLSSEASGMIENEITAALALELDRVVLRGTGTPPEPKGILNQTGVTLSTLGTGGNGAAPDWDDVIDAVANIRTANGAPNALIWASRTAKTFGKLKDLQDRYLTPPDYLAGITRLESNQVPTDLSTGYGNTGSEIYVGDWSQVLVGLRTDVRVGITALVERYIDNLQVGLLAYLRADVAVAHANHLVVVKGVTP